MARFILDVDLEKSEIWKYLEELESFHQNKIMTVYVLDETNTNQFYSDPEEGCNNLTKEQINRFNSVCNY